MGDVTYKVIAFNVLIAAFIATIVNDRRAKRGQSHGASFAFGVFLLILLGICSFEALLVLAACEHLLG